MPHRPSRLHGPALALVAVVAQVAFWYAATPGPVLLGGAEAGVPAALRAVGVSLVTLLLLPLASWPLHGVGPRAMGLRIGATRRALPWVGAGLLLAAPILAWAGGHPALREVYPWPGVAALRAAPWSWPAWAFAYGLYYLAFEAFYRGFLLSGLRPWLGRSGALWAQAGLATLIHVGKPLTETIAAFPASLLFGLLTLRARSILPAVLLHLGIGLLTDLAVAWRAP